MDRRGYRSLHVWRRARELVIDVFKATAQGAIRKEWSLRDQIRKSALSVPSNIAEGSARGSNRDSVRFFFIARGSLAELATQVDIAAAVGLLEAPQARRWQEECDQLAGMITRLIDSRCAEP
jgi:four helix bundle protein